MKLRKTVIGLMGCVLASTGFSANAGIAYDGHNEFKWTGEEYGYTVEGNFTYDNTLSIVSGYGSGPTTGIQNLSVSFFSPSHSLLFSVAEVVDGVSSYDFLSFTFDTILYQVIGDVNEAFDIGRVALTGDYHVAGIIGGASDLFDFNTNSIDSISTGTHFSVVSEPSSLALFTFGLAALIRRKRKSVSQ
jgi:hypothetical protein